MQKGCRCLLRKEGAWFCALEEASKEMRRSLEYMAVASIAVSSAARLARHSSVMLFAKKADSQGEGQGMVPQRDKPRLERQTSDTYTAVEQLLSGVVSAVVLAVVIGITVEHHIPVFNDIQTWHGMIPSAGISITLLNQNITQEDLINTERSLNQWHSSMWTFRTEMISNLPFVDMDDEEEVCASVCRHHPLQFAAV